MGKDDKEDSGFGFKDRAKAEETLRLLESHDANYRRLTVRGLLGRAKRVLSMTKAEEKIKNIKEAMEVFENWLAELDASKKTDKDKKEDKKLSKKEEKKEDKKNDSDKDSTSEEDLPSESVSGLGFKDREAAEGSLKVLEGRDPDYQLLAVKGLLGRAKRVLTCTKDDTKLANIKEAMSILEGFVDDFDSKHMSRQTCPYLSLGIARTAAALAGDSATEQQKSFISAYASVRGEHKRLRNVHTDGSTWDVVRNKQLAALKEKLADAKLFKENDEPTAEHLEYLLWAYSPDATRAKKLIKESKEVPAPAIDSLHIDNDRKRRSSACDETPSKKKKE